MKMTTVLIRGYGSNEEPREFEVLPREELVKKLDDLNEYEIHADTMREAIDWQMSGRAYTYLDARDGKPVTRWIQQNTLDHPWDSFYEIELCSVLTPYDIETNDLLDCDEWDEWEEWDGDVEDFLAQKHGPEEYQERVENVIEHHSLGFSLNRQEIGEQVADLYEKEVAKEAVPEPMKKKYWKHENKAGISLYVQQGFDWGNDLLCVEDGVWGTYCPMDDGEHKARGHIEITREEALRLAELAGYDEV